MTARDALLLKIAELVSRDAKFNSSDEMWEFSRLMSDFEDDVRDEEEEE